MVNLMSLTLEGQVEWAPSLREHWGDGTNPGEERFWAQESGNKDATNGATLALLRTEQRASLRTERSDAKKVGVSCKWFNSNRLLHVLNGNTDVHVPPRQAICHSWTQGYAT